ncbi:DUF2303 family protein [Mangrovicoccus ximenensis]|uniref:DUF2303 family protein n=1 Tax=Mangrovicoccus ximenensis TaxID=1911570 RepID=UPI000D3CD810|nr:DUF2303 family protein [Mangrovicoccus ximenensis]
MNEIELTAGENTAQTVAELMKQLGEFETVAGLDGGTGPHLVTLPKGRTIEDLTQKHREALEFFKPLRRKGTAQLKDLDSLILWANRFKAEESVLYASPAMSAPKLTCIADYHAEGPGAAVAADPTARHCHHRAVYDFPLSEEWKAWMKISGQSQDKDELGEFIEANAKDIMDPTPAIIAMAEKDTNQPWENRLIRTAQQIEGRFGQLHQLLAMSKRFQVFETSDLKVQTNRDTGEAEIQFLNEHKDAEGKPLNIPNLIIITIPVFLGGAPYRMPVRFRYRKAGAAVKFIMTIYNPEKVFEAAFDEAVNTATEATGLPCFRGTPEA